MTARKLKLSKYVKDLLEEFATQEHIKDDFKLHVLQVTLDDKGEIEQCGNALPVTKLEIDTTSKELLMHFTQESETCVNVAQAKAMCVSGIVGYEVFASRVKETDEALLQLETPLLGFGENIEHKYFFSVCKT